MTYKPDLLVSQDLLLTAAILRHYENMRKGVLNHLRGLTSYPRHPDWGMHLPDSHPDVASFAELLALTEDKENETVETLTGLFKVSPLYPWTAEFKGLSPGKLVARFLGEIGDPYIQTAGYTKDGEEITEPRVRTFPELRRLCGMSVENGKSPSHVHREQSSFRAQARVRLWLITDQMVKQHDEHYHPMFLQGVEKYQDERYRGVDTKGKPWTDKRFAVVGRKRARVLVGATFLKEFYREGRRLHECS